MTECEKMKMFIDDNYAFEYIVWEQSILPIQNIKEVDTTDIPDIDFDIID